MDEHRHHGHDHDHHAHSAPAKPAGVLAAWGILLTPAVGAVFMSASTVIVAINAQLLKRVSL